MQFKKPNINSCRPKDIFPIKRKYKVFDGNRTKKGNLFSLQRLKNGTRDRMEKKYLRPCPHGIRKKKSQERSENEY